MATFDDWSRAIRPANLGNMEVTRGSMALGTESVEEQTWITGVRLEGWMREMAMLE